MGAATIKTQPGKFSIAGEGLNIGKEGAEPVTALDRWLSYPTESHDLAAVAARF